MTTILIRISIPVSAKQRIKHCSSKTTKNIEGARIMQYKTEQVVLKEKFIGHDAKNLVALDNMLNKYAASGWTLCTMTTTVAGGTGLGGGDRTVFTLIFQKI